MPRPHHPPGCPHGHTDAKGFDRLRDRTLDRQQVGGRVVRIDDLHLVRADGTCRGDLHDLGDIVGHTVSVIDPATNTDVDTISLSMAGSALAYDGTYVYVTNGLDDTVSVIYPANNTVIDNVTVGTFPVGDL